MEKIVTGPQKKALYKKIHILDPIFVKPIQNYQLMFAILFEYQLDWTKISLLA